MKLILSIHRNFQTVKLYILAEDNEPGFLFQLHGQEYKSVVLHHNRYSEALQPCKKLPHFCDEDYIMEFKSARFYSEFCGELKSSEYNDNKQQGLFHNCADAVTFALHKAGIPLQLPPFYHGSFYNPSSYILLPGFISTPRQLYEAAKKYKVQTLKKTNETVIQIEQTKQSLLFLKSKLRDESKREIDIIVQEIGLRFQQSPHHAEFYLAALLKINATLTNAINNAHKEEKNEDDERAMTFFQKRSPCVTGKYLDEIVLKQMILVIGIFAVMQGISKACYYLLEPADTLQTTGVGLACSTLQLVTSYLMIRKFNASSQNEIKKADDDELVRLKTKTDTNLSTSMRRLSTSLG